MWSGYFKVFEVDVVCLVKIFGVFIEVQESESGVREVASESVVLLWP